MNHIFCISIFKKYLKTHNVLCSYDLWEYLVKNNRNKAYDSFVAWHYNILVVMARKGIVYNRMKVWESSYVASLHYFVYDVASWKTLKSIIIDLLTLTL